MKEPAIACQDLVKFYGTVAAVRGVTFSVVQGSCLVLLGPSGGGKTTVLRLIAGLEAPDRGMVTVGGRPMAGPGIFVPPERRSTGLVFQDFALFPHLTVEQNVGYGVRDRGSRSQRVLQALRLVGLENLRRRMPSELSGGEQQRVALARALAPEPQVLLLDEPFSNLDAGLRSQLRSDVRRILKESGATTIFVTHDQEEALCVADEAAVMLDGKIVQQAKPQELYERPANVAVAAFLGETNFLAGRASGLFADCEAGRFSISEERRGEIILLLKKDRISLLPDPDGPGRVVSVEYFGAYRLARCELPSGKILTARLEGALDVRPGRPVRIGLKGPAAAFPA